MFQRWKAACHGGDGFGGDGATGRDEDGILSSAATSARQSVEMREEQLTIRGQGEQVGHPMHEAERRREREEAERYSTLDARQSALERELTQTRQGLRSLQSEQHAKLGAMMDMMASFGAKLDLLLHPSETGRGGQARGHEEARRAQHAQQPAPAIAKNTTERNQQQPQPRAQGLRRTREPLAPTSPTRRATSTSLSHTAHARAQPRLHELQSEATSDNRLDKMVLEGSEQGQRRPAAAADALKSPCDSAQVHLSASPRHDMGSPVACDGGVHLESASEGTDDSDDSGMDWTHTINEAINWSTTPADGTSAANAAITVAEPNDVVISERPTCWPGVGMAAAERRHALQAAADATRVAAARAGRPALSGVIDSSSQNCMQGDIDSVSTLPHMNLYRLGETQGLLLGPSSVTGLLAPLSTK